MLINGVYYKITNSLIEVMLNKFLYKRNIYKIGEKILIEKK